MRSLLLTGSSSLVGSDLVQRFSDRYVISALGRKNIFSGGDCLTSFQELDIRNKAKVEEAVIASEADVVVNYAAKTDVDECERERENLSGDVYLINAIIPGLIASACRETGKKLIHLSTDFVFDGTSGPYYEADRSGPVMKNISWYGYSKSVAENAITSLLPEACIVRISYPYRARYDSKLDFARKILDLYQSDHLYPLFDDQIISPTLVDDVSFAIDLAIRSDLRGFYHVASRDLTTPFQFAGKLIQTILPGSKKEIKKGSILEFASKIGKVPRPIRGGLLTHKIEKAGYVPHSVDEGIEELRNQMKSKKG